MPFSERTLYRVLETLGATREEIINDIQVALFAQYAFEHTDINMDWTSKTQKYIHSNFNAINTMIYGICGRFRDRGGGNKTNCQILSPDEILKAGYRGIG